MAKRMSTRKYLKAKVARGDGYYNEQGLYKNKEQKDGKKNIS